MTENQFLLVQFADECIETAQRVHKALQFGINEVQPEQPSNNAQRIEFEVYDLKASLEILRERGILPAPDPGVERAHIEVKKAKVLSFMEYALHDAPHPHGLGVTSGEKLQEPKA